MSDAFDYEHSWMFDSSERGLDEMPFLIVKTPFFLTTRYSNRELLTY